MKRPTALRFPVALATASAMAALVAGALSPSACAPAAAPVASGGPAPADVDAIFSEWDTTESPGCTAAAMRDGGLLFEDAWGMSNLELAVPLQPDSVFYAGSVSKQFTAGAVALLALRGKLDLDDDIRDWFPELNYEQTITVRQLVHHTSGIRDYFELMDLAGWPDRAYVNNALSLEMLTHQRDLNFEPGARHLYSNSGYMLLAELVERASGQTLREYAAAEFFEPLGMSRSGFEDDYRTIVPNRASSYGRRGDGTLFRYLKAFDGVGSGGLMTTAGDLLIWASNLLDPEVGGPELIELLETRGILNDGEELDYAFGITHGSYRGAPTLGHGGSLKGFRTAFSVFPEQRFGVSVLCNFAWANPGRYAERIADVYFDDVLEPAEAEETTEAEADAPEPAGEQQDTEEVPPFELAEGELPQYEGEFFSEELQVVYRIRASEGELQLRVGAREPGTLRPLERDRFRSRVGEIVFERGAGNTITGFVLNAGRVRNVKFGKQE